MIIICVPKENDVVAIVVKGCFAGDYALIEFKTETNRLLDELVQNKKSRLVIDCSGIRMMDSSGLGALWSLNNNVQKREGRIVLAGVGRGLQNLLAITRLNKFFDRYETVDEAVASFGP